MSVNTSHSCPIISHYNIKLWPFLVWWPDPGWAPGSVRSGSAEFAASSGLAETLTCWTRGWWRLTSLTSRWSRCCSWTSGLSWRSTRVMLDIQCYVLALQYKPCWHLPRWSSSPADSFSLLSVLTLTMLSMTPLTPITCNDVLTVSDWSEEGLLIDHHLLG